MKIVLLIFSLVMTSCTFAGDEQLKNGYAFLSLANEMHVAIIHELDHSSILSTACTCSYFYETIKEKPEYYCKHILSKLSIFTKNPLIFPYVNTEVKTTTTLNQLDFENLPLTLNHLKTLYLDNSVPPPNYEFLNHYTNLTSLVFNAELTAGQIFPIKDCTNLKKLSLSISQLMYGGVQDLLQLTRLVKLQKLMLRNCVFNFLDIRHWTKLTELNLNSHYPIDKKNIYLSTEQCVLSHMCFSYLTKLSFSHNDCYIDFLPFTTLINLRELNVEFCNMGNTVSRLSQLTLLERLNINNNRLKWGNTLFLTALTNLRCLIINNHFNINGARSEIGNCANVIGPMDVNNLLNLTKLEILSLYENPGVFIYLDALPNLKEIYIADEDLISKPDPSKPIKIGSYLSAWKKHWKKT